MPVEGLAGAFFTITTGRRGTTAGLELRPICPCPSAALAASWACAEEKHSEHSTTACTTTEVCIFHEESQLLL